MATTTNYSWTTPDDTSLVKDGAAAIRSLGSSIDTTTKALNPSTTLGDIEYRSATANTNTRLPIGTAGQLLTVSGGVPAWTTVSSGGKNWVQVATGTLSGSALTLSSLSGYDNYILLAYSMSLTTTAGLVTVTYNNDTANYRTLGFGGSSGLSSINITSAAGSIGIDTAANGGVIYNQVNGCLSTTGSKSYNTTGYRGQATAGGYNVAGIYASNTAITRIDLTTTDTFDNGTYFLYGSN